MQRVLEHLSNEKNLVVLGYTGDYTTQFNGIIKNYHFKDPYETGSIMESKRVLLVAQMRLKLGAIK